MRRRERRKHRHFRHSAKHRQHRLDTFARGSNIIYRTETNGVAEKMSHRAPRCVDRCLAVARNPSLEGAR